MASKTSVLDAGIVTNHNFHWANVNISGETFSRQQLSLTATAFSRLIDRVAPGALHDSGEISDDSRCLPGTRVEVLTVLIKWALAAIYEYPIRWLNGPAGAGKSAIMRSFAEILVGKGLLLATFFFFKSDGKRNTLEHLIPTITYQLCIKVPPLRPWVEDAIELNPLIFTSSLSRQTQTLIIDPFLHYFYDPGSVISSPFPHIILIDGLDECTGHDNQQEVLETLSKMIQTLPIPITIVFASRPEPQIRSAFAQGRLREMSTPITLDDSFNPVQDLRYFYITQFDEIRSLHPMRSHLGADWPSEDVIRTLVRNASGQFIYAATVMKFIKSYLHDPADRLQIILQQAECLTHPFGGLPRPTPPSS